jgi:hypothetical protein
MRNAALSIDERSVDEEILRILLGDPEWLDRNFAEAVGDLRSPQ